MTSQVSSTYKTPPPNLPTRGNKFYTWFLIALLFGYWLLVLYVERANTGMQVLWPWNIFFGESSSSWGVVILTSMFSFNVMRHLVPVIVGTVFAYEAAVHLVYRLYDFPEKKDARKFLTRLRSSGPVLQPPLLLSSDTLEEHRADSVMLHVGGPGRIMIKGSEVVVTEINDSLCRILPAGKYWLYPFEYVHAILDLRPQNRSATGVKVRTRNGVELLTDFNIRYQIKRGRQQPTRQNPYPFDEAAVRLLAYKITVQNDAGEAGNWEKMPLGLVTKMLTITMAQYSADEILHPAGAQDEPYLTLSRQVLQKAKAALANNGVELLDVNIYAVELPDSIKKPYLDYWKMQSNLQIELDKVDNAADALEEEEKARADAEVIMIEAILEGIRRARRSGATTMVGEVVALRLVEALEQMAHKSQGGRPEVYQPLLPQITQIRQELAGSDSAASTLGNQG